MKILSVKNNQAGFTLVQAIFIVVVLAFLGLAMMRLSGVQNFTSVFSLQGSKAFQAARSGLEWGAVRASSGLSCNSSPGMTIEGFDVTVTCSSSVFIESGLSTTVYHLNATATFGSYGNPDFVSRRLEMKMAL